MQCRKCSCKTARQQECSCKYTTEDTLVHVCLTLFFITSRARKYTATTPLCLQFPLHADMKPSLKDLLKSNASKQ